jgi:5-hydroxyisourate hydrolase-like protein (transthyretin family)
LRTDPQINTSNVHIPLLLGSFGYTSMRSGSEFGKRIAP